MVAVTIPQLTHINRTINNYRHLRLVNENLQSSLAVADSLGNYWQQIAERTEDVYLLECRRYDILSKQNTYLQDELQREHKKSRQISIGVGVGGTFLGLVLGVLLTK